MSKYKDDETLYHEIKTGDRDTLKSVYGQLRDAFKMFIMRMYNAQDEDALDVYPEAFSIFYFNIRDGKLSLPLKSTLKTYLFAIGKRIYQKRYHGTYQHRVALTEDLPEDGHEAGILDFYEYREQASLVSRLLSSLSEKCREILELSYIKDYTAGVIMHRIGLNSEGAVRKRKFDCMKKLKALVAEQGIER